MLLYLTSITWGKLKEGNSNVKGHEQNKSKSPHYFTRELESRCVLQRLPGNAWKRTLQDAPLRDAAQKD